MLLMISYDVFGLLNSVVFWVWKTLHTREIKLVWPIHDCLFLYIRKNVMGTSEQKALFLCIKYHCLSCRFLCKTVYIIMAILVKLILCTSFLSARHQSCMSIYLSDNIIGLETASDSDQNGKYNVLPAFSKYTYTDLLLTPATN